MTAGLSLKTRETVPTETPACFATSLIVTVCFMILIQIDNIDYAEAISSSTSLFVGAASEAPCLVTAIAPAAAP